jgi:hypothetical protein
MNQLEVRYALMTEYWNKSLFSYLGYNICYERGKYLNVKTANKNMTL